MDQPIEISHFSDLLCVWAYVAQIRIDELQAKFGNAIEVKYHFCDVFGDTETKVVEGWADRGGPAAYGEHVQRVAAEFDHVEVHRDVWSRAQPKSSMPCHLYLAAVRLVTDRDGGDPEMLPRIIGAFREAFFRDARDISDAHVRQEVAAACGLPTDEVEGLIANGSAHAVFSADLTLVRDLDVRVSPTLVFNQGRQRLTGNVGYRIIESNVRELLDRPQESHSWC